MGQLPQHLVPHGVAESIVDVLETVDVQHDYSQRALCTLGPEDLSVQGLFHVSPVEKLGQDVSDGLLSQRLPEFEVGQGQPHGVRHGLGELEPAFGKFGAVSAQVQKPEVFPLDRHGNAQGARVLPGRGVATTGRRGPPGYEVAFPPA